MRFMAKLLAAFGYFLVSVCGQPAYAGTTNYKLGDTTVRVVVSGGGNTTFVALHENESTSVRAAKSVIGRVGGRLVELKHRGSRNVSFTLKGKGHSFDPNRIFTESGIKRTLKPYSAEAHKAVKGLADELLKNIRGRAVVALHNNTDGAYSIKSYQPGGNEARNASAVHMNPSHDPDDFFFVTNRRLFEIVKAAGYNVALQSGGVTDDGSLSVHFARKGVVYINVEAQSGHSAEQTQMIADVVGG
jgi:hypothetical protein